MKQFYLSKRGDFYYVRFVNPVTKTLTYAKSTGKKIKEEAEFIAMQWLINGSIPKDIRKSENKISNKNKELIQGFRELDYSKDFVNEVIETLKLKGFIDSVVYADEPSAKPFTEYLKWFWDFDNSPYIKEKKLSKHQIHKTHCDDSKRCADLQYKEFFGDKAVGVITLKDMKAFRDSLIDKGLSASRVNNILRAGTTALKYAFYNGFTQNNAFSSMVFCGKKEQKKRDIFTLNEAQKVLTSYWFNKTSLLANKTAFFTGMRLGEVRALQLQDIGTDRIYIRHNFNKKEGLKCCKNGEKRNVYLPPELRDELLDHALKNPFNQGGEGFVFFGKTPNKPIDAKYWGIHLDQIKERLGINKPDVTFHSWRHLFITVMANTTTAKKLQQVTGHKTAEMIELYSDHQQEAVFQEISREVDKNFIL